MFACDGVSLSISKCNRGCFLRHEVSHRSPVNRTNLSEVISYPGPGFCTDDVIHPLLHYGTPFGSKLITSVIRSNFLDRRNFLTDHLHSTLYLIRSCGFDTKFFLMGLNRWLMIDRSIIRRSITDLDHSMGNEVVRG